jgi:hypothetical protein
VTVTSLLGFLDTPLAPVIGCTCHSLSSSSPCHHLALSQCLFNFYSSQGMMVSSSMSAKCLLTIAADPGSYRIQGPSLHPFSRPWDRTGPGPGGNAINSFLWCPSYLPSVCLWGPSFSSLPYQAGLVFLTLHVPTLVLSAESGLTGQPLFLP